MSEQTLEVVPAYIALGANLGQPRETLRWAVGQLAALGTVAGVSKLYRTAPVGGPSGQPDYFNAAALLHTTLEPLSLLEALHGIEAEAGRVREVRWGARTLDLDLILYGAAGAETVLDTPRLTLPHPRAWERAFVLAPLRDLAPTLTHTVSGVSVAEALATLAPALANETEAGGSSSLLLAAAETDWL